MQLTCPKCKTANQENARFCSGCGVGFAVAPIPQTNHNSFVPLAIFLGGSFVGLLILGASGALNNNSSQKAEIVSQTNTTITATPSPTATPVPTIAEHKTKTDELLKLNIDNYEFADLKPFDTQMDLLRAVPKESKDYPQAQVMLKKLINKVAPVTASIALLGAKPKNSEYDGRVEPVVTYLKATMNDYEDSEWIEWSSVVKLKVKGEPFWAVRLKLRGKNAFGAKILKNMLFLIRNNQVVATEDLPL